MKRIIHIHRRCISQNIKKDAVNREPPIIVRRGSKREGYANEVFIDGPCRIVYSPDKPLDCGARVWIETEAEVKII